MGKCLVYTLCRVTQDNKLFSDTSFSLLSDKEEFLVIFDSETL